MHLQVSECWPLRRAATLIGLLLLCSNALALPVVGSASIGSTKAYAQNSAEDNTSKGDLAQPTIDGEREQQLKKRLLSVAVWGGAILTLLAVAYGYFRLELTTRGFYSGRLQIVSGIISLTILVATYFLWHWLIDN